MSLADYTLTVPPFGQIPMKGWTKGPLSVLALVLCAGLTWQTVAPASDEQEILTKKLTESLRVAAEYKKHLGETPVPILARGLRVLSAYGSDECLLDDGPNGRRLILPLEASTLPLLVDTGYAFEGILLAAPGPRACPLHQEEKPVKDDPVKTEGCWVTRRWTYRDGCWANFHQDRCQGTVVVDHQGCKH